MTARCKRFTPSGGCSPGEQSGQGITCTLHFCWLLLYTKAVESRKPDFLRVHTAGIPAAGEGRAGGQAEDCQVGGICSLW